MSSAAGTAVLDRTSSTDRRAHRRAHHKVPPVRLISLILVPTFAEADVVPGHTDIPNNLCWGQRHTAGSGTGARPHSAGPSAHPRPWALRSR